MELTQAIKALCVLLLMCVSIIPSECQINCCSVIVVYTLENLCTRTAQSSRGVRSRRVRKIYYFGLL